MNTPTGTMVGSRGRSILRLGGRLLAGAVIGIVGAALLLELGLRIASVLVAGDPAAGVAPADDRIVILCVGDSHTWGNGKGYPAALAERLAARSPRYRVLNFGVSGSNTAQLRRRFPEWLARFQPAVVVVWSGVNNLGNRRETEIWEGAGVAPLPTWRRVLEASRLWRFVHRWREQAALERTVSESGALFAPGFRLKAGEPSGTLQHEAAGRGNWDDAVDPAARLTPEEVVRVTALDIRWLAETAASRGIPTVVVTYPINLAGFVPTNEGIELGAHQAGVPVVSSAEAVERVRARSSPEIGSVLFDPSVHPTQILYDEVGAMVLDVIDREGWLRK